MVNVCAKYCGSTILLAQCDTEKDAEEFMKKPYTLFYADEIENGEDDEVIYPHEMFIEDEIPFTDVDIPFDDYEITDELPF